MDIVAALKYPFKDKDWLKRLFAGALIVLIPIIGLIVLAGYMISVIQEVASGNEKRLPTWRDLGDHTRRGFSVFAATFAHFVPVWIAGGCLSSAVGSGGRQGGGLPTVLPIMVLLLPVWVAVSTVLQVGIMRYAATEKASCLFEVGANLSTLTQHSATNFPTLIVTGFAPYVFILLAALVIYTFCLPHFVFTYGFLFIGHMLGRLSAKLDLGYKPSVDTDFWG